MNTKRICRIPVNETLCAIWYHLYSLKCENSHRGVLLLVKLQDVSQQTVLKPIMPVRNIEISLSQPVLSSTFIQTCQVANHTAWKDDILEFQSIYHFLPIADFLLTNFRSNYVLNSVLCTYLHNKIAALIQKFLDKASYLIPYLIKFCNLFCGYLFTLLIL